jgi:hypothetical protein
MKTRFLKVEAGMRHAVVLSAALLSACATVPQESPRGGTREGAAAPQTAAPQKSTPAPVQQPAPAQAQQPAAVPAQQPAPSGQGTPAPATKPKHNVEED